jgi:hypothetical protein
LFFVFCSGFVEFWTVVGFDFVQFWMDGGVCSWSFGWEYPSLDTGLSPLSTASSRSSVLYNKRPMNSNAKAASCAPVPGEMVHIAFHS